MMSFWAGNSFWAGSLDHPKAVFTLPPLSFEIPSKEHLRPDLSHSRTVSAEPIPSTKVNVHRRGSKSLNLVKNQASKAAPGTRTTDYDAFTSARAALSAKKRKELKRVSHHSIDSVSALRHLCSKCQIFPLEHCLKSPEPGRIWISPLKRLIWHKDDCPLCSLLIRSLCQPNNDPFKHPVVLTNLPDGLRKQTMATWLAAAALEDTWMNTNVSWADLQKWPFGVELVESEKEATDPSTPSEHPIIISSGLSQGFLASMIDDCDNQSASRPLAIQATSPCYVAISNNFTAPGLLDVKLLGYPRGPKTQIVALSQFRLRIESDWPTTSLHFNDVAFSYGHILDPHQIDLSLGRMWLDDCEQNHGVTCSKQAWAFKLGRPDSFRLVDVDDLSVIEVTGAQVWSYRYVALSYVRGVAPTFELLQSNRNKLLRTHGLLKIFRHSLPRTIRHAITATRAFGERYLWVDALCVVQDDEIDVRQQLNAMDRIYGNALLTIVAADAEHAAVGLRGVESGSRHVEQIFEQVESDIHMMLPLPEPKGLTTSVWNKRAWTFQERLLSRRMVIFMGGQIIWRCHKAVAFEDMTAAETGEELESYSSLSIKPQHLGQKKTAESYLNCSVEQLRSGQTHLVRTTTFSNYASLVHEYSQRRMQFPTDVLHAFAGLSHVFELCFKGPIRQGLPEALLDAALLWRPVERLCRRSAPGVPSWSWAGWEGPLKYEDAFRIDTNDWALKRIASDSGIEAFRPLLRYFSWRSNDLEILNANGLGVPLQSTTEELPEEWEKYPPMMAPRKQSQQSGDLGYWDYIMDDIENLLLDSEKVAENRVSVDVTDLPVSLLPYLGEHHLIFRTSCTESISFGRLKRSAVLDPKIPLQYPILQGAETRSEKHVGHLRLDGDGPRCFDPTKHSLIVISEALYFNLEQSDEQGDSNMDFPLYNVMLVEWNNERTVASRLGLGRIFKDSWRSLIPLPAARVVILE